MTTSINVMIIFILVLLILMEINANRYLRQNSSEKNEKNKKNNTINTINITKYENINITKLVNILINNDEYLPLTKNKLADCKNDIEKIMISKLILIIEENIIIRFFKDENNYEFDDCDLYNNKLLISKITDIFPDFNISVSYDNNQCYHYVINW